VKLTALSEMAVVIVAAAITAGRRGVWPACKWKKQADEICVVEDEM